MGDSKAAVICKQRTKAQHQKRQEEEHSVNSSKDGEKKNVEGIIQKEEKGIMAKKGVATWGTELGANELPSPGTGDGGFLYS